MLDAHCHLSFMDAPSVAQFESNIVQAGIENAVQFLSCTVDPSDYVRAQFRLRRLPGVFIGVGLHPWWVSDDLVTAMSQTEATCDCVYVSDYIGEVGLDFSPKHNQTHDIQIEALRKIFTACASVGHKVISLHCVQATEEMINLIDETDVVHENLLVFHWYSGSDQHLQELIKRGCHFSINPQMLETKKGQAYAKTLPLDRLHLETDWPDNDDGEQGYPLWADFKVELTQLLWSIAELRGMKAEDFQSVLQNNAQYLLTYSVQ